MRKYTLLLSVAAHVTAVSVLVIAPLFAAAKLPFVRDAISFIPVQVALPPPPQLGTRAPRVSPAVSQQQPAPLDAPPDIQPEPPQSFVANLPPGIEAPRDGVGIPFGIRGGDPIDRFVPPPPSPPVRNVEPDPVRVGHGVTAPQKTHHVAPIYPPIAVAARREGIVILEAVIAEDGSVRDVKILRSVPLLDQAAVDAVRQWRFTPTLLSGQPVPIVMTVTVDFKLN